MKYLKTKKNGYFKHRRAVPTELRDAMGKREVGESLKTEDRSVAAERYAAVDRRWTAIIESHRSLSDEVSSQHLESLKKITDKLGVAYVAAS